MISAERVVDVYTGFDPIPWQSSVLEDQHQFIVICAGRRTGKTVLALTKLVKTATELAGSNNLYVAPTYGMAKSIAWAELKEMIEPFRSSGLIAAVSESELLVRFKNGSTIQLKGAENEDALRGMGLDFIVLDEFSSMKSQVWSEILRPSVVDRNGKAFFISTPKGFDAFFNLYEKEKTEPQAWKSYHFQTLDNPYIDRAEIEQARRDMDETTFLQEFCASFVTFAGQIFHWEEGELPALSWDETWYGGDFGYSVDPAAVVKIYRKADEFWVQEILYQKGLTNPMLASAMRSAGINGQVTYFDAAEPKSIEELRRAGLSVQPCDKGPDSVRAGIDFLKSKKITIVKGSENLIREHRSYCWRTDKSGADLPEPMKVDDHLMDATRYGIYTHCSHSGPRIWTA
jgi:phage terminase large subunit